MFNYIANVPQSKRMFLCKPNKEVLFELNGIDESSASLTEKFNNQCELSFDYNRWLNATTESNGYHDFVIGMLILVEDVGYFKIKYPPMKYNDGKELKSITASSLETELEDKDLNGFNVNTGKEDSLEYLVSYNEGETEDLLDDYKGIPYDYIVFYNTFPQQLETIKGKYSDENIIDVKSIEEIVFFCNLIPRLKKKLITDENGNTDVKEYVHFTYDDNNNITAILLSDFNKRIDELITFYTKYRKQLSLLDLALEKCDCLWKIGEVDTEIANKKFQFSIDNKNIYSFLTDDLSQVARCIFSFDTFTRTINVKMAKNIGEHSGVIVDRNKLMNTLEVSCNTNNLYTRFNVRGGNNIDLKYVNFGNNHIEDLSYFMNARNEQGKRIYVSDDLYNKYMAYLSDIELARDKYISLTKQYHETMLKIDELKNKVPNDNLKNDWDSFTMQELETTLKSFRKLLATLQTLYKEDYPNGCNSDESINEDVIKTTFYWQDYFAYKNVITQIEEAIHCKANDEKYSEIDVEKTLAQINAWKTEWSLYGIVELENKIQGYNNQLKVLLNSEAVLINPTTKKIMKWSELTDSQKLGYSNLEANYRYDTYIKQDKERTECQKYLDDLKEEVEKLNKSKENILSDREQIVKFIGIKNYNRNNLYKIISAPALANNLFFTEDEIKTLTLFYIDKGYSNENIFTTSLDNIVSEIDIQKDLLKDAQEQLSIESQPQVSFNTSMENVLAIEDFKDFDFIVGNYISLQYYDNYYVDVRLVSLTYNPCIPTSSISVSFSSFITSKSERTDLSNILGLATGNSGDSSSGGSGNGTGSDGFGNTDKVDITISNTMLAKLLNTEMFGTKVSNLILDTLNLNELTAKYAKFEGLANGTTIIDGKCIQTGYIVDKLYNSFNGKIDNTKGSIVNLEDGKFNFGGGKLRFDGSDLYISGNITANAGYIGGKNGFTIAPYKMYSGTHSNYNSNVNGVYIGTDAIALGKNGVTYLQQDGTGKIGKWNFNENSIWHTASSWGYPNAMYFGKDGLSISNIFKVSSDGSLTCTKGEIGGWDIDSDCIYHNSAYLGNANGMYFGNSGLSVGNKFIVYSDGSFFLKNGNLGSTNISITPTSMTFKSNSIIIDSSHFKLKDDGSVSIDGGSLIVDSQYGNKIEIKHYGLTVGLWTNNELSLKNPFSNNGLYNKTFVKFKDIEAEIDKLTTVHREYIVLGYDEVFAIGYCRRDGTGTDDDDMINDNHNYKQHIKIGYNSYNDSESIRIYRSTASGHYGFGISSPWLYTRNDLWVKGTAHITNWSLGNNITFPWSKISNKPTIPSTSDFASANHNHDGRYSRINHNHNSDYASKSHSHSQYVTGADLGGGNHGTGTTFVSGFSGTTNQTIHANTRSVGSSDIRLKENIQELSSDLKQAYLELKPVTFNFKKDLGGLSHNMQYGFIAQETEKIFKKNHVKQHIVYTVSDEWKVLKNEDKYIKDNKKYCLDVRQLHAMHVYMIQEQQKEINSLKETIAMLSSTVEELKNTKP